jgi:hypothetical protein
MRAAPASRNGARHGEEVLEEDDRADVVNDLSDDPQIVSIRSVDGRQFAFTMTTPSSFGETPAHPEFVFERVGEHRVLAHIVDGNGDRRDLLLTPSIEKQDLATIALHGESEAVSSK